MYSSKKNQHENFSRIFGGTGNTGQRAERRVMSAWEWEVPQPTRNQQTRSFETGRSS